VAALTPAPELSAEEFLRELQCIEQQFGRVREGVINAPRPLDLDLLAYGRLIQTTPSLTLPHPRAHLRHFVLQPLQEIAPDYLFPGQKKTVRELLAAMIA
jgi:2-amino-4-hydroxy-6-hydroxymethyldihydropteridine diphosphokinase